MNLFSLFRQSVFWKKISQNSPEAWKPLSAYTDSAWALISLERQQFAVGTLQIASKLIQTKALPVNETFSIRIVIDTNHLTWYWLFILL